MAGFFVQLIKRVSEKEDVFTECLAAALRDDPALARLFVLKLCRNNALEVDARVAAIDIATHCRFPAAAGVPECCVDMVLTLDETTRIGVENKLFAAEGRGPNGIRDQLRNYLQLGLSRVAYIRAQEADVANDVCENSSRYLKPIHRRHFLWPDFYAIVMKRLLAEFVAAVFRVAS